MNIKRILFNGLILICSLCIGALLFLGINRYIKYLNNPVPIAYQGYYLTQYNNKANHTLDNFWTYVGGNHIHMFITVAQLHNPCTYDENRTNHLVLQTQRKFIVSQIHYLNNNKLQMIGKHCVQKGLKSAVITKQPMIQVNGKNALYNPRTLSKPKQHQKLIKSTKISSRLAHNEIINNANNQTSLN